MQTPSGRPDRTLIVILSIIAAVVILALVVVFTRGGPAVLDPSTPEGVVQTYTNTVVSGDREAAMKLLSSELRDNCDTSDVGILSSVRVTLISTKVFGDTATVRVTIANDPNSGVFGGASYESEESFTLVREGGSNWKIDSTPWQLMICYKMEGNQ